MKKPSRDSAGAWERHNRSQLRYFRSLSLRQKMEAVEGMADLVRRFGQMRAEGAFYPSPAGAAKPGAPSELREGPGGYHGRRRDLEMSGIHTGALGHYLTALGVLRAVSKSDKWEDVRGYWRHDRFTLATADNSLDRESLLDYFVTQWKPSPFERWWKDAQAASKKDAAAVSSLRAIESDEHVDQLDAVMVHGGRRVFSDLFGTGGNVGKRDLAKVWKACHNEVKKHEARTWLEHTLFGDETADLPEITSAGTWFVFSNKMFNSGQNWFREGRLSPWSFLLAMEGARLLRGGVHRRLGTRARGKGVFPFMCRPAEPSTDRQIGHGKSEFWAPLWEKPATLLEIDALFRSGLAEIGGRPASAPHEFAVAALDAGVEAGVSAFARFEFRQTTSAQVFEAIPREHVRATGGKNRGRWHSRLLIPLLESRWLDRLPAEPRGPKQRGKFVGLRGPIEAAIVHLSEDPEDSERWRSLLLLISRTQHRIDRNKTLRERCVPVPKLHAGWFKQAWPDPPPELRVARAIASIQGTPTAGGMTQRADPLVVNIFGVEIIRGGRRVFPKARPNRGVWHEGHPTRALVELLRRRLIDANELDAPPLYGSRPCRIGTAALYLAGGDVFDDELLAQWLPALTLIDWPETVYDSNDKGIEPARPLHPMYSLFRPLFDPENARVKGKPLFPFDESDSRRPHATSIRRIVNLLLQNQIDEAVAHARRRYLGAGWRTFVPPAGEMTIDADRLVAALLIPVNPVEVAARFCRDWLILPGGRQ